jgi:hypothetical protein
MQQGVTVSDILYLTPEGAPHVFRAPDSALDEAASVLPDKKGYGFDGCSPKILMDRAEVKDGMITFPGGSSYRLMVLPQVATMTPALLAKIRELVKAGATMVGTPPVKSPGLSGYPACDGEVQALARELWGSFDAPKMAEKHSYGKGFIHWGGELSPAAGTLQQSQTLPPLYPEYELTASLLKGMGVKEDFTATGPVRYGHRRTGDKDIYFVSNRTGDPIRVDCGFRVGQGSAQLWDPLTGEQRPLPQVAHADGLTVIPMEFDAFQSFFVVFDAISQKTEDRSQNGGKNFPELKVGQELSGSWEVAFDPKWGGPGKIVFDKLQDWSTHSDPGIRYYSGIATYRKTFSLTRVTVGRMFLDVGVVHEIARVRLNGKDLGTVWCAPWRIDISNALKEGRNDLEIEVANLWPNRLIGDEALPADQRFTWTIAGHPYKADSKLLSSGLLGPVQIMISEK